MARSNPILGSAYRAGDPLLYETHAHTVLCRHATGTADAYCEQAIRLGLGGIIFCEHNPMPADYSHQERIQRGLLSSYVAFVKRLAHSYADTLDVRLGIECDYLPEYSDYVRTQLQGFSFEYVLGSVHCQFQEFLNYASPSDPAHFEAVYFDLMARAAESGLFDALAHPHLSNAVLRTRSALQRRTLNVFLDRVADAGVALELNTGGRLFWDPYLYAGAARRGVPVVLAGDAHAPSQVGAHFAAGLSYLRQVGYLNVTVLLGEERVDIPIESAFDLLKAVEEQVE